MVRKKRVIKNKRKGAFYFFPNVTKYFGRKTPEGKLISTDEDLSLYVLQSVGVVSIPGSKFQKPGFIRLAFASSPDDRLDAGCKLLAIALLQLKE
jgi:aspartate aminotransferase